MEDISHGVFWRPRHPLSTTGGQSMGQHDWSSGSNLASAVAGGNSMEPNDVAVGCCHKMFFNVVAPESDQLRLGEHSSIGNIRIRSHKQTF